MTTDAGPTTARKYLRVGLLLGLGAAIFGAAAWSCIGGDRFTAGVALSTPRIPDPNGYDDVLAAGRMIEKAKMGFDKLDIATADETTLTRLVDPSREALVKARQGLDRPFQVPVIYDLKDVIDRLMNESAAIRAGLARSLLASGRLAELQGRIDDASRDYLDVVRLGDALSHHVPMLPYQVSVAVDTQGLRGIRDLRTKLSADRCRRLIGILQDLDRDREPVAEVIGREHQFMESNLDKMGIGARVSMSITGILMKEKRNVASSLESYSHRLDASRRLVLADLSVRLYRLEHGEAPATLSDLVPSILKSVPIDPYSGKPLIYRKLDETEQLYSVGPDRDDDKLTPVLPRRHVDTSNGDFTVESL
jgi:hypothetical protein